MEPRGDSEEEKRFNYREGSARTKTRESRKSLIRCPRQRNSSSFAEGRRKEERREKSEGEESCATLCVAARSGKRIKSSRRL